MTTDPYARTQRSLLLLLVLGCTSSGTRTTPSSPDRSRRGDVEATGCAAAFDSLEAVLRHDYAGYREKARGNEALLAALADSIRTVARTSDDYRICIPALQRLTHFFHDPHLMVWQAAPPDPVVPAAPAHDGHSAAAAREPRVADPDEPTLRFDDDSTNVIRIPSLDPRYKTPLDSLVDANRARLLSRPVLVADLRGNGGGCTCTYDALLPLVYSGPFRQSGQDLWTSAANVAYVRGWLADGTLPETFRAGIRDALPLLEASPNTFVPFPADTTIRLDTVFPLPRAVAVLVDGGCASSCEDFVLMARQSAKVTIVGSARTAGVHDYGNVRALWLPGWRRLRVPMSRSHELPAQAIDNVGLAPDVWVRAGTPDTVRFAGRVALARTRR